MEEQINQQIICEKCGEYTRLTGNNQKFCPICRVPNVCPTLYGLQQIYWKQDAEYARKTIAKLQELEILLSRAERLF